MVFERSTPCEIPFVEAATFFLKCKYAAEYAPPDETGELEGRFAVPVEQVMALMQAMVVNEFKTHLAYQVYARTLRDLARDSVAEEFEDHAEDELEHAEFLLRRLSVLGGPVALPDIPSPPPASHPEDAIRTLIRIEQEGIAMWRQLQAMLGENPMKFDVEAYMAAELHHLDELWQLLPHTERSAINVEKLGPEGAAQLGGQAPVSPPPLAGQAAPEEQKKEASDWSPALMGAGFGLMSAPGIATHTALNPSMTTGQGAAGVLGTTTGGALGAQLAAAVARHLPVNEKARNAVTAVGMLAGATAGLVGGIRLAKPDKKKKASDRFGEALVELQKEGFAVTSEGHQFDAKRFQLAKEHALEQARLLHEYNALPHRDPESGKVEAPLLRRARFSLQQEGYHPMAEARHMDYAAKQHAQGSNAWNPFGGLLTPLPEEEGGTSGLAGMLGRPKAKSTKKEASTDALAAEQARVTALPVSPETQDYLAQELQADQESKGNALEHYRQRFAEAQSQLQQLPQLQAQLQQVQQEAAGKDEQILMAQQQAQQAQQQALQQIVQVGDEKLQKTKEVADLRMAFQAMRGNLMDAISASEPPPTQEEMQASMGLGPDGTPAVDPSGGAAGAAAPPSAPAPGGDATQAPPEAPTTPSAPSQAQPGSMPSSEVKVGGAIHYAAPAVGALAGAGLGYLTAHSDTERLRGEVDQMAQESGDGGFRQAMRLAAKKSLLAYAEVGDKYPFAPALGGAVAGGSLGSTVAHVGPNMVRNVKRILNAVK